MKVFCDPLVIFNPAVDPKKLFFIPLPIELPACAPKAEFLEAKVRSPPLALDTLNDSEAESVVPIKFVAGLVPALPVSDHWAFASPLEMPKARSKINFFMTLLIGNKSQEGEE